MNDHANVIASSAPTVLAVVAMVIVTVSLLFSVVLTVKGVRKGYLIGMSGRRKAWGIVMALAVGTVMGPWWFLQVWAPPFWKAFKQA